MDSGSSYKQYINDGKIRKSAFFLRAHGSCVFVAVLKLIHLLAFRPAGYLLMPSFSFPNGGFFMPFLGR